MSTGATDRHHQRPGHLAGALLVTRTPPDRYHLLDAYAAHWTLRPWEAEVATIGRYDGDLQMFVEKPRDSRRAHLRFLRWLAERRMLEHPVFGPPSGALAEPPSHPVSRGAGLPQWSGRERRHL